MLPALCGRRETVIAAPGRRGTYKKTRTDDLDESCRPGEKPAAAGPLHVLGSAL